MASANTQTIPNNSHWFSETSSLNKYFICDHCGRVLQYRSVVVNHLKSCMLKTVCSWCNVRFKNRDKLVKHACFVHGKKKMTEDFSIKEDEWYNEEKVSEEGSPMTMGPPSTTLVLKRARKPVPSNKCPVCHLHFRTPAYLKYHIRSYHFNLTARTKSYDDKEINQIWHEKVYNTSKIVEIKKASHNLLLIRKMEDDSDVTVQETDRILDLSGLYPTNRRSNVGKCQICSQEMLKKDLEQHYKEWHIRKEEHTCATCNRTFQRAGPYLRHVCNNLGIKKRKLVLYSNSKLTASN